MEKLYIVIPAYNEASNIRKLVDEWYPVIQKYHGNGQSRMVIINDGSTDQTWDILQELKATRPLLQTLSKPNGGHGPAVLYGYRYAIRQKADFIFQTDSDGQTLPSEFDQFWSLRKKYDAVIGTRPNREDGASRAFVEDVLCLLLRVFFGVRLTDANAPYRLMKRQILEKYLPVLPKDYHLPNAMLTTFFSFYQEKLIFVNITFRPRQGGNNSMNVKSIIKTGQKALPEFWRFRRRMRGHTGKNRLEMK